MLLELMFALFAITVCIMPSVTMMITARKINRQAQIQSVAYQIAQQQLETLRAQTYGNRSVVSQAAFAIPPTLTSNFSSEVAMSGSYSISSYSPFTKPPVQEITVKVTWKRMNTTSSGYSVVELSALCAQEPGR